MSGEGRSESPYEICCEWFSHSHDFQIDKLMVEVNAMTISNSDFVFWLSYLNICCTEYCHNALKLKYDSHNRVDGA